MKGHKVKSAKEKRAHRQNQGNPGARQQEFLPGGETTQDALNPSATRWDDTCKSLPGNSLETRHPLFLLGAGHISTLCLACTKLPDSQKESSFSLNYIICTKGLGTVSSSYQGMVGTVLQSKFPDITQGPTL